MAHDTILYSYTDNNWKDKLTAYDGQTITYDAIGNPLDDGRRRYEWQAGRQLKKVYVKAGLKEGTKPGVDEQSGTVLKIAWSNGNLLDGEVASTQASAIVTRCGVDVTEEYAASAFAWKRDSGNAGADETWNAAHAGMKTISLTEADLNGNVKITCTLTGDGPSYGSITVDEDMDATHTRGTLDANDTFQIVNGELKVTTSRGNVYALEDGKVKAAGAKLSGSITAETKLFASQPEDMVEFSYDHNGLRTQKKVTKADGTVETTNYVRHGDLLTYLTQESDEMHFFYDEQERPAIVDYNGTLYSYVLNIQGDIVGIIDASGSPVVEYKYNAWGKLLNITGRLADTLGSQNPFRYREYVYDEETELYYLPSRYYASNTGRFINADASVRGNLYEYCRCNPVNRFDPSGDSSIDYMNEMARMHDKVVKRFAELVDGETRRRYTRTEGAGRRGRYGYPDIVNLRTNEAWEVKPLTAYGIASGREQIRRYESAGRVRGHKPPEDPIYIYDYTFNGVLGQVIIHSGVLPEDEGLVYYEFKAYEESRQPETEYVPLPVPVPEKEPERKLVQAPAPQMAPEPNWGFALFGLGVLFLVSVISPIPGDEVLAGAALAAML